MRTRTLPSAGIAPDATTRQSARARVRSRRGTGGVEGNARLTASAGVVLLLLLAAEGVTILALRPLFSVHVFVGVALIPPVALKLATTGWRFARYYRGDRGYRAKGAPRPLLRAIAPAVVGSTAVVIASGVALVAVGHDTAMMGALHKASFIAFLGTTGIHVLGHILQVPGEASADLRPSRRIGGGGLRAVLLAAATAAGFALAIALLPLVGNWHGGFG